MRPSHNISHLQVEVHPFCVNCARPQMISSACEYDWDRPLGVPSLEVNGRTGICEISNYQIGGQNLRNDLVVNITVVLN